LTYQEAQQLKPLFIPLKREYFEAFERGEKDTEYRRWSKRWSAETCALGRRVVLSLGYGKARRLRGVIIGWRCMVNPPEDVRLALVACYGERYDDLTVAIKIEVER